MIYLFSVGVMGSLIGGMFYVLSLVVSSLVVMEETDHFLFAVISVMALLLVWPTLEEGMRGWVMLAVVVISLLLCGSSPFVLYLLFELSLLPVLVLVVGWGVQTERISAGYYLMVYTFLLSIPFFLSLIFMGGGTEVGGPILSLLMSMAFMVKTPLYLFHIWLPKAHTEAPTVGSIILASILLKMGGVGFIWVLNYCGCDFSLVYLFCALFGSGVAAVSCGFQSDVKAFVAFSSVAHMNFITVVVMLLSCVGDSSSSVLMLSHSFISGALLMVAGGCFHMLSSRLVYFLQSSFVFKEVLFIGVLGVFMGNLSIPPLLSFWGELSSFVVMVSAYWLVALVFCVYYMLVAYYSLFLGLSFIGSESKVVLGSSFSVSVLFIVFSVIDCVFMGFY